MQTSPRHRVAIVGGGFGGLYAARRLGRDQRIDLTLIDRRNHHVFQPLLYQVATGALAPGEIAQPLRSIVRRNRNTTVLLGEAVGIDAERREVQMSDGGPIPYDTLVVATGARHSYFGHDEWARFAQGLKSIDDATEVRRRILIAFEAAEREHVAERRREWMTFVVVGGGPTGVELAGALGEIANDTLKRDFRSINPPDARIVLVEAMERVLPGYPSGRSASAKRQLERLGVTVRTKTRVVDITEHEVVVEPAAGGEREPPPDTNGAVGRRRPDVVVLAGGGEGGRRRDGQGRPGEGRAGPHDPRSSRDLRDRRRGDPALEAGSAGSGRRPGRDPGRQVRRQRDPARRLAGKEVQPFRFSNRGDVAVIGRLSGVTNIPWLGPLGQAGGFLAWLLWLGIHISYLIGFANRLVVLTRWSWSFFTHGRGSRLITGQPLLPDIEEPEPPA